MIFRNYVTTKKSKIQKTTKRPWQKGNAQRGNQLAFGSFGIKALETKWITGRQIEAARIAVTTDICNVKDRFGFVFSPTNLSPESLLMCVWVRVRVRRKDS